MLLASCTTPSAREWALESARLSVGSERTVRLRDVDVSALQPTVGGVFGVQGAQYTSADVLTSMSSMRDVCALLTIWESGSGDGLVVDCDRSAGEMAADAGAFQLLLDIAGSSPNVRELADRLQGVRDAFADGSIEWVVGCPPQVDAIDQLSAQIAIAAAAGVRTRGVVIAPMPRKSDGWPSSVRKAAKELAEHASLRLHPTAVARVRGEVAPRFEHAPGQQASLQSTQQASGERMITFTLPGLGDTDVAVGTWSAETAYPTTHIVISINGTDVRMPVDATVRRCRATDAVLAGDTVTITFEPDLGQWPSSEQAQWPGREQAQWPSSEGRVE